MDDGRWGFFEPSLTGGMTETASRAESARNVGLQPILERVERGSGHRIGPKPEADSSVAGLWLSVQFVLLIPDLSLLLNGSGLGARHSIGQHFGEILAAFLTASASQHSPEIGFVQIPGNAMTAPVKQT